MHKPSKFKYWWDVHPGTKKEFWLGRVLTQRGPADDPSEVRVCVRRKSTQAEAEKWAQRLCDRLQQGKDTPKNYPLFKKEMRFLGFWGSSSQKDTIEELYSDMEIMFGDLPDGAFFAACEDMGVIL